MEAGRVGAVVVAVLLTTAVLLPTASGGAAPADAGGSTVEAAETDQRRLSQVDTDRIRLIVAVQPDGDAVWQVEYRTNLDDQNTTDAFESLAADIRSTPEEYTARFADRIRDTVASAENSTGREMTARNFSVSARTGISQGVVAYSYEWTNFTRTDGDRLVLGDAIEGFFLDDRTSLRVEWPEDYGVTDVGPEPDSQSGRSLTWEGGRTDFGPDQPRVVVEAGATTAPVDGTTTAGGGATDGGDDTTDGGDDTTDEGGGGFPFLLVGLLVAVVVAVGAVLARRGVGTAAPTTTPDAGGDAGDGASETTAEAEAGDGERAAGDDGPPVDEELLSNEERVLGLLEDRGGRIKQQEIVEALDWTEAKTSQVVSGMRDEGTIEGFRLGRENVLTLPDEDITESDDGDGGEGDAD